VNRQDAEAVAALRGCVPVLAEVGQRTVWLIAKPVSNLSELLACYSDRHDGEWPNGKFMVRDACGAVIANGRKLHNWRLVPQPIMVMLAGR